VGKSPHRELGNLVAFERIHEKSRTKEKRLWTRKNSVQLEERLEKRDGDFEKIVQKKERASSET